MKYIFTSLWFCFSFVAYNASAQTSTTDSSKSTNHVLLNAEMMPEFPGGEKAMLSFLSLNLHYPESARRDSIQGKVILKFVVNTKGKITDVQIQKSLTHDCDNEVIRVVKLMPRWKPGVSYGEKVDVYFLLPVSFKL